MNPYAGDITNVHGIRVGQAQSESGRTGVTVVLCRKDGAVGGVSVRGAAPGTRETDLLKPGNLVEKANAVVLSGGSAFGLEAAGGVMRYLEQMDCGMDMGVARVPIVPAAVLYDLNVGDPHIRPVHTQMDGDTMFALATGRTENEVNFVKLCAAAAEVTARAIANALYFAKP